MSYILQIETATTVCSVALAKDGKVLGCKQLDERNIHADVITVFIDELLTSVGIKYADIDAIAVSCGPGSYTGLRIGVSTAKGLCFALDKPLIAVETLDAMTSYLSADGPYPTFLFCPMIDARRMEVYTALFDGFGQRITPTMAKIIDENSFSKELENYNIAFFGDGAEKCFEMFLDNSNARLIAGFCNSATHLTTIALKKFADKDFEDVAYFEPYYLKEFIPGIKKN